MPRYICHLPAHFVMMALLCAVAFLAACSPVENMATPTPRSEATPTAANTGTTATETPATVQVTMPVPVQAGKQPATLRIAELNMVVPVTAMGWELTLVDGVRTTGWAVPERTAGWMPNTAGVGEPGNMVIAGHQAQGDAVFAALALGEILPGQTIAVTGADGRSFDYRVVEVSDPVPVLGATAADTARAAAYVAPSEDGRLTLVSGWPGDTTTHRIFAVAELVGPAQ